MPPKKAEEVVKKPLLGRPTNHVKMGIVGLPNVRPRSLCAAWRVRCGGRPSSLIPSSLLAAGGQVVHVQPAVLHARTSGELPVLHGALRLAAASSLGRGSTA